MIYIVYYLYNTQINSEFKIFKIYNSNHNQLSMDYRSNNFNIKILYYIQI